MIKLKLRIIIFLAVLLSGYIAVRILQFSQIDYGDIEKAGAAGLQTVAINEIAWMGRETSANDEWLELKNLTAAEIDLSGWTLKATDGIPAVSLNNKIAAGGFYLLERTSDETVPAVAADMIYVGALGNGGEKLELRDAAGNLIDSVDASGGWPAGDNATKQTMERKTNGKWQTSAAAGGTPKAENSGGVSDAPSEQENEICGNGTVEEAEACDDGNNINGDGCSDDCMIEPAQPITTSEKETPPPPFAEGESSAVAPQLKSGGVGFGAVVVNEFVSDPADGEEEWVEIYNTGRDAVELSGWMVIEGSGAKTVLSGSLGASGISRFMAIAKPKGNLNNKGDIIILKDKSGKIIDQVAYGDWDDGNIGNNAPAAGDPFAVARRFDGYNTGNNAVDFAVTKTLTKSGSNIINNPDEDEEISVQADAQFDYCNDIFISEVFPNPAGEDSQAEFIELYNAGDRDVNLHGWQLGDESKRKFAIKDNRIIKAGKFLVLYRSETKIALNNSGDSVKLYQPFKDAPLETTKFKKGEEGWSYARMAASTTSLALRTSFYFQEDIWEWTEVVTPGEMNVLKAVNHAPEVDFDCPETASVGVPVSFDATDTVDPDSDELIFSWDFGDGFKNKLPSPQHTYLRTGIYSVTLTVYDGRKDKGDSGDITKGASKTKTIKVVNNDLKVLGWSSEAGSGEDLVKTRAGGNKVAPIIINEILPDPTESGDEIGEWIELYNQGDVKVNLLDWRLEDSRGQNGDFRFQNDEWLDIGKYLVISRITSKIALNNNGDFVRLYSSEKELTDEVKYDKAVAGQSYSRTANGAWQWTPKLTPGKINQFVSARTTADYVSSDKKSKSKNLKSVTLEQINQIEAGDFVRVKGTVAVLPGVFSSQYFYIVGSPGVQVYSYKKDFPKMHVGDVVEITGEVSVVAGEKRVKTAEAADIKVLERRAAPVAVEKSCQELDVELCGQLITLSGEVADRKGSTVYLDDGTEEAVVYLKKGAGISLASVRAGDRLAVTGIVSLSAAGARLLPRSPEDIVRLGVESDSAQTPGQALADDFWTIEKRDKKIELLRYLLIVAGGAIAVMAGMLIKMHWKK